jgi:hypothetical protein
MKLLLIINECFHDVVELGLRFKTYTGNLRKRHLAVSDGNAIGKSTKGLKNSRVDSLPPRPNPAARLRDI